MSRIQQERRSDPYPWAWEIPVAVLLGVALVLVGGVHLGRSLANLAAGAGWAWVPANELILSVPGVLRGDAAAGLDVALAQSASVVSLRIWIAVVEVVIVVVLCAATAWGMRRWGPQRMKGMASPGEAEQVLGVARLRRDAAVIRPDLYGRGAAMMRAGAGRCGGLLRRVDPVQVGWPLGVAREPRGGELWVPWDRTAGVIGPQGSGKTLDLLVPALLAAPGAALVTLTKPEDLLLSWRARQADDRPCVVLDPFGLVHGLTELVWDPVQGCVDPVVAERRAKAFTAGTVGSAQARGSDSGAAQFYAAEAAKVLQAFFHAAALTGGTLDEVMQWVANPARAARPGEVLQEHPDAAPLWDGLLYGALHGDERTAGNTITTVQQSMSLFFQASVRARCTPGRGRPATDIADVIRRGGTIYLLGREDPYASASPLMTAVAEHVLDTALAMAHASPWGRLCPPMLACLDELPSTAPLPTLITRMANERALGLSFLWAAQTRAQLTAIFGEHQARTVLGLTNVLTVFGGSKDVGFNREISDLMGRVRVPRRTWQSRGGRSTSGDDIAVLTEDEVRRLPPRHALVIAENLPPIIARLRRCIDGVAGKALLAEQDALRTTLTPVGTTHADRQAATARAVAAAHRHGLTVPGQAHPATPPMGLTPPPGIRDVDFTDPGKGTW